MGPNEIIFILGGVFIAVSIPLIAGIVPPNCYYGFRTRKTLSDKVVWYKANKFLGVGMALASLASMGIGAAALRWPGSFPMDFLRLYSGLVVILPVGVVLVASLLYLRSL